MKKIANKAPTQRQLRVGEEMRHALSVIFLQETIYEPELMDVSVTVSEVRVSPDLKNSTAYVMPLGGSIPAGFEDALNKISPKLRHMVGQRVKMRFVPRMSFKLDDSFENANKIEKLFAGIEKTSESQEDE